MQQGIGPAERLEQVHAPGQVVAEPVQPGEQAAAQRALLRGRVDPRGGKALEHGDGVMQVRREEGRAQVAAEVPAHGHEGVAGGAGVELGDESHDDPHALRVRMRGVQRALAEVFVDVPDAPAVSFRGGCEQAGGVLIQSEGGQPAPQHELVTPREPRIVPLEDERMHAAVRSGPQAVHPGLEAFELDRLIPRTGLGQHVVERVAQLGPAGLGRVGDGVASRRVEVDHVRALSSWMAATSRSWKTRSHAIGRIRHSA